MAEVSCSRVECRPNMPWRSLGSLKVRAIITFLLLSNPTLMRPAAAKPAYDALQRRGDRLVWPVRG
jgi:hypothetical protein